ncbi:hypothetical protein ABT369_03615 [Dactylosporangium sp. NPDC000244]|uniref:hypothetical protein n=1 Tax=Dactylosporangium sp. NPDC000244 TaxID=3154365 RepID=UPI00332B54AF
MTTKPDRVRPLRRKPRRPRRPRMHPSNWVLYWATQAIPVLTLLAGCVAVVLVLGETAAYAAERGTIVLAAPETINVLVDRIRLWLVGILVAVATLFLTVGGLRYMAANGDPGEVERAKLALKSAALGYALAALAPLIVGIVGQWVA